MKENKKIMIKKGNYNKKSLIIISVIILILALVAVGLLIKNKFSFTGNVISGDIISGEVIGVTGNIISGIACSPESDCDFFGGCEKSDYCEDNDGSNPPRDYCFKDPSPSNPNRKICVECIKKQDCSSGETCNDNKQCVPSDDGGGGCVPQKCESYKQDDGSVISYECGIWLDGCGGTITCGNQNDGSCPIAGQVCSVGKCYGGESCTPNTKQCIAGSTNKFRVCLDTGIWGSAQTCPTGQICSGEGICKNSPSPPCVPECSGKTCGASNNCGGSCQAGSGCTVCLKSDPKKGCTQKCTPSCSGKTCGASDGCGGSCQAGSGCTPACNPSCFGITCGEKNQCGNVCGTGSGCDPPTPGTVNDDGLVNIEGCIPLPLDRELLLACIALSSAIGQTISEPPPGYKLCHDNPNAKAVTCKIDAECGFSGGTLTPESNFCIETDKSCSTPKNKLCPGTRKDNNGKLITACCSSLSDGSDPCGLYSIGMGLGKIPYCKNNGDKNTCNKNNPGYCQEGLCCDVGPDGINGNSDDKEECAGTHGVNIFCQPINEKTCTDKGEDYCPGLGDSTWRKKCCPKDTCRHMGNDYPYCYAP